MDQKQLLELIRTFSIFADLEETQLQRIAKAATVTEIPKNAVFYSEEKHAQGMHILLSGRVKLFKLSAEGKEQTIFVFGPGEPFCLCSAFSDGKLPANLSALEKSRILALDPKEFEALVRQDPSMLLTMMRVMARRLKEAMDMIDSLSLKQIPSRLAAYFLSREQDGVVTLDISYRELSKIIGVTPEALSRAMKKMESDGMLRMGGNRIELVRPEDLALM